METRLLPSGMSSMVKTPLSSVTPPVTIAPSNVLIATVTYGRGCCKVLSITFPVIFPGRSVVGSLNAEIVMLQMSISSKNNCFIF